MFATGPFDGDQLLLLNRRGEVLRTVGSPQQFIGRPDFSPDGGRVAVWGFDYEKGPDIWVHEVDRPSKSRLTNSEGLDSQPVFSAGWGSDRIYF